MLSFIPSAGRAARLRRVCEQNVPSPPRRPHMTPAQVRERDSDSERRSPEELCVMAHGRFLHKSRVSERY